jgi:DUF4097 and DUF4098 domain-containing protein YvlB
MSPEHSQVLKMIEEGKITADEAVALLKAIDASMEELSEPVVEVEIRISGSGGSMAEEDGLSVLQFERKANCYRKMWII